MAKAETMFTLRRAYRHFLLFWLLSTLWICHFHYQLVLFLPLYLSFHFDSHSDSPHFSHFQPVPRIPGRFQTTTFSSYSSFSHPYSTHSPHSIPQFLIFTDSLLSWSSLKNYFRKIVALVQKRTNTPVCYYYITFSNRLLFISSMTSSVLSPEVWSVDWIVTFMSKWGSACLKLLICNL